MRINDIYILVVLICSRTEWTSILFRRITMYRAVHVRLLITRGLPCPYQGLPCPYQGLPCPYQGLLVPYQGLPCPLPRASLSTTNGFLVHYQGLPHPLPRASLSTTKGLLVHYLGLPCQLPNNLGTLLIVVTAREDTININSTKVFMTKCTIQCSCLKLLCQRFLPAWHMPSRHCPWHYDLACSSCQWVGSGTDQTPVSIHGHVTRTYNHNSCLTRIHRQLFWSKRLTSHPTLNTVKTTERQPWINPRLIEI